MYFVDVDDAELAAHGGEAHGVSQVAHLIDTIIRGAVDFEDVHAPAFSDFDADGGFRIEVDFRSAWAVECFGEDASGGGFAGSARADEEVSVGDAILRDGIAQCSHDVFLAQDVIECLGAVFSSKNLVAHWRGDSLRDGARWERGDLSGRLGDAGKAELFGRFGDVAVHAAGDDVAGGFAEVVMEQTGELGELGPDHGVEDGAGHADHDGGSALTGKPEGLEAMPADEGEE